MSENNDILEYIVQCLLTNRVNDKKTLKKYAKIHGILQKEEATTFLIITYNL